MKIVRLVVIRVAMVLPVAVGVVTLTFFVSRVFTGDPVELFIPPNADEQLRIELNRKFGLDKSLAEQYGIFLKGALVGDLGISVFTGRPVTADLKDRLPATLELAIFALVIATVVGVPLGVIAAMKRDGPLDFVVRGTTLVGISLPAFWLGLVALFVFFFHLGWFPGPVGRFPIGAATPDGPTGLFVLDSLLTGNWGAFKTSLHHLALPGLTLGYVTMAPITRIARAAMVESLQSDYIRTARAMGISPSAIYFRYALKNALLPVVTIIGSIVGFVVAGTVLVESVFNWPGVGRYALNAIQRSDFPALQGFVIWAAVAYVLAFLVVDLLYLAVDPRTR